MPTQVSVAAAVSLHARHGGCEADAASLGACASHWRQNQYILDYGRHGRARRGYRTTTQPATLDLAHLLLGVLRSVLRGLVALAEHILAGLGQLVGELTRRLLQVRHLLAELLAAALAQLRKALVCRLLKVLCALQALVGLLARAVKELADALLKQREARRRRGRRLVAGHDADTRHRHRVERALAVRVASTETKARANPDGPRATCFVRQRMLARTAQEQNREQDTGAEAETRLENRVAQAQVHLVSVGCHVDAHLPVQHILTGNALRLCATAHDSNAVGSPPGARSPRAWDRLETGPSSRDICGALRLRDATRRVL